MFEDFTFSQNISVTTCFENILRSINVLITTLLIFLRCFKSLLRILWFLFNMNLKKKTVSISSYTDAFQKFHDNLPKYNICILFSLSLFFFFIIRHTFLLFYLKYNTWNCRTCNAQWKHDHWKDMIICILIKTNYNNDS